MAKTPSFRKKGKVSIWVAVRQTDASAMEGVDILKDLCGVKNYDLDDQEVAAVDDTLPKATVSEILSTLSYSSSFLDAAMQEAAKKNLKQAYWAVAQFDFAYKPEQVNVAIAKDPLFLGVFDWNDSEDDEE